MYDLHLASLHKAVWYFLQYIILLFLELCSSIRFVPYLIFIITDLLLSFFKINLSFALPSRDRAQYCKLFTKITIIMYIKYASALLFVVSLVLAAPTASPTTSASNPTARQFNDLSISAGTGGTGLTQAVAVFPGNPGTLSASAIAAYNVSFPSPF